eukprot:gene5511-5747_t
MPVGAAAEPGVSGSCQLPADRPTANQLLGLPLVLWKDGHGQWQCFEDRCPHRLAPLSEGRLEPTTGNLMCSYHGWQFNGAGSCTSIPQIGDSAAHSTACASKRTCAIRYPCQVSQGLLWVWPDSSSADLAAVTSPALSGQYGADGWTLLGGEWFSRDLEYGYDTLMENLFDPSHIPFAHHGIMGSASRDKAQPLNITTTADVTPTGAPGRHMYSTGGLAQVMHVLGCSRMLVKVFLDAVLLEFDVSGVWDSAPFRTAAPTDTLNTFVPPVLNVSSQTNTVKGTTLVLTFYGIPLAPGRSRVITAFFTNAKMPGWVSKAASAAEWWFHLGQNQVLDSDAMLLHVQERLLHDGRDKDWRSAFFLPAGADAGIIKFRTWYHDCAGGAVPFPAGLAADGSSLGPVKPREVVMDRFSQHTSSCKACSAALKWIQRLQALAVCLAGLAAVAVLAASTAASTAAAVTSSEAVTSSMRHAVTTVLVAIPVWQLLTLSAVAMIMVVGHQLLGQLKQRFLFIDYVHADRK